MVNSMHFLSTILVLFYVSVISETACNWPAPFRSSTWTDSTHGDLVFTVASVTGYTYVINDQPINQWSCAVADTFETDGRLIFLVLNDTDLVNPVTIQAASFWILSSSSFSLFSSQFYAYLCMTYTKITDNSYRYYQNNAEESGINNYRIFLNPVNSLTNPEFICDDQQGASGPEYQVLIKTGGESSAKIHCPYSFLGMYGYIHTSSDGTVTCDVENSSWDMCADNTQMTFSYSQCSTKVAYSASDTVWCVDNVPVGTTNYVMTFNGGESAATIDNSEVYRYACFAISSDGTSASVTPQHCKAGQTPTGMPTSGVTLQMVVKENCSSCPILTAPDRGFVSISTNGAVTTALYGCDTNYTLSGPTERECQPDNSWTNTAPSCSCADPPLLSNGVRVVSNDGFQANYTCNLGYSLKGLQTRHCLLATSEWENVDPECVQCTSIEQPTGGILSYSTSGVITTVNFTCEKGYTLSGQTFLTCLTDGNWDQATPTCEKCPTLTNPISGSVVTSTSGLTTTATYSCAQNYDLIGESTLTCSESGSWDFNPPTCICQSPKPLANGTMVSNGATVNYTCDLGYTINGLTSRACASDGTGWSGVDPFCAFCVVLDIPPGGSIFFSTEGAMTIATYTCQDGFSLDGSRVILCRNDGIWNEAPSTCVQCPDLQDPASGIVSISNTGTVSSAIYSCVEGYHLSGSTIRQCLTTGSWEFTEPTCSCLPPVPILNGVVNDDGLEATYTCNIGYSLNGISSRACQTDGSGWSSSNPTCATCDTLSSPTGGNITMITNGVNTQAKYTCESGYTLNGESTITCRSDGSWNFEQPTCVSCPTLTDPDSGFVVTEVIGTKTTATFTCVDGYYLSGSSILTCKTSGSWDKTIPTCKCTLPSTPTNGIVSVSDTSTGSVARYTCQNGFTLKGLSSRQCQAQGLGWEDTDPSCVPCGALSTPEFGQFTFGTDGTTTTATFSCNLYATMSGERLVDCLADGTWSHSAPSCAVCPTLPDPASGFLSVSTNGTITIATYSCVTGYQLKSTGILTCQKDGTWNIPEPTCICTSPSQPTNGLVTLSTDSTVATYTCSAGFQLSGISTRVCLTDGTGWNGTKPTCVEEPVSTTTTKAPEGILLIHVSIVTVLCLIIVILGVALIVFGILYCKAKKSRIGSSSERLVEEPEKPIILPEAAVPPTDTSHNKIPKNPKHLSNSIKFKRPLKFRRALTSKDLKRPTVEKSPTIISASSIDVDDLKSSIDGKDKLSNPLEKAANKNFLKMEKETKVKQASPRLKKRQPSKKDLNNIQASNNFNSKTADTDKLPENLNPVKIDDLPDNTNLVNAGMPPNNVEIASPIREPQMPVVDAPIIGDLKPSIIKPKNTEAANIICEPNDTEQKEPSVDDEINVKRARLSPIIKPPTSHGNVLKRKRKSFGVRATSFKDDIREHRPRTPIEKRMRELGIDRIMTPDLLQQVAFNYIHPVYTHDTPDSERSGRDTVMSGRTYASYT